MRKLLPLPIALAPVVHADPAENKRLWDVVCRSLDAGMTRDEIIDGLDVSMPGHSESDWLLLMNYAVMRPEAAWGTPGGWMPPRALPSGTARTLVDD